MDTKERCHGFWRCKTYGHDWRGYWLEIGCVDLLCCAVFGLLMAIPVLLFKKSHLIPYGPFLSLAALVCILMQDYFIGLVNVYVQLFVVLFYGFHS